MALLASLASRPIKGRSVVVVSQQCLGTEEGRKLIRQLQIEGHLVCEVGPDYELRDLPMPDDVLDVLRKHKAQRQEIRAQRKQLSQGHLRRQQAKAHGRRRGKRGR